MATTPLRRKENSLALRLKGVLELQQRALTDMDVGSEPPWMGSRRPSVEAPGLPLTGLRSGYSIPLSISLFHHRTNRHCSFFTLLRRLNKPQEQGMPITRRRSKLRMKLTTHKPRMVR